MILLAKACADVLLGNIDAKNRDDFIASWQSKIESFDEYYENGGKTNRNGHGDDNDDEIDDLFRTVSVCGNGYTICKKIEALLKLVFMPQKDQPQARPTTISQQLQTEATPVSSRKTSAAYIDAPEDAISMQYMPSGSATGSRKNTLSRPSSFRTQSNNTSGNTSSRPDSTPNSSRERKVSPRPRSDSQGQTNPEAAAVGKVEGELQQEMFEPRKELFNAHDDIILDQDKTVEDIDSELIPMNTTVIRNDIQVKVEPPKVPSLPIKSTKAEKRSHPLRASKSSLNTAQDANTNAPVRLTDFYPHFGMIFPVAYNSQVNVK